MDVSCQSISKWENGSAYPKMEKLIFTSEFFDVSLNYLIPGNKFEDAAAEKKHKSAGKQHC